MLSLPLTHAFGQRYDLPVPLALFIAGGALAVFFSFLLVLPTPVPRGDAPTGDDRAPRAPRSPLRGLASWLVLGALCLAGVVGKQAAPENIITTAFWLLWWVAVPISCGVLGDWTKTVNPFAVIARVADREGLRRTLLGGPALRWPRRLAWWPAVVLFLAFACGELIYNGTTTRPDATAYGLLVYAAVSAVGALVFGADAWLERGEVFSVLFRTWGRLGWWRFGSTGRRGFGGGLGVPFDVSPSRITFVLLLLVSVSFDGLVATPAWKSFRDSLPASIRPGPEGTPVGYLLFATGVFILLIAAAWTLFALFALAVRRVGHMQPRLLAVVAGLLPSLVPIAFGYEVAHNAEYLAINGQLVVPLAGDPAGLGWHLLPPPFTDDYVVNRNLVPSGVVWYLQVALIVAVHVAAVILAHHYLGRTARTVEHARRAEWPWIVAMVGYTMTSLWLLAQPLVEEGHQSPSGQVTPANGPAVSRNLTEVAPANSPVRLPSNPP